MSGIDREYALQLDREDRLAPFRELFINDNPEMEILLDVCPNPLSPQ